MQFAGINFIEIISFMQIAGWGHGLPKVRPEREELDEFEDFYKRGGFKKWPTFLVGDNFQPKSSFFFFQNPILVDLCQFVSRFFIYKGNIPLVSLQFLMILMILMIIDYV